MQTTMQTPMRAMPLLMAAALALSGCYATAPPKDGAPPPETADADGVPCDQSAGAPAVWIDVVYSGTDVGTPSERCEVDPGTRITWRGPSDSREPFQVRFHEASPGVGGPRELDSGYSEGRQRIRLTADNDSGEYRYDILTREGGIDPAIIIR